jgi:N-acetylglucosamine kinase-like BadF-type ATPase
MTYYLGFDGGGTKTECVLTDRSGRAIAQSVAGPSNPLRIGYEAAFNSLTAAADHVLSAAKLDAGQITAVCAGLAGAGRKQVVKRVMAFLVETFPNAVVHVTTDMAVALEAAAGSGEGVILIAGTGSSAYGRNASGKTLRAGGYGPWIGDEGSAFDIGRRALIAIARQRDGLAPVTLLGDLIPAALELPAWDNLIERIAQNPDEVFPRIFPLVVDAAEAEDDTAREILFTAALGLAQIAATVIRKLDLQEHSFVLAKSGGVHGRSPLFDSALDAVLASAAPRARIERLTVPPAIGAAQLARRLFDSTSGAAASATIMAGAKAIAR